MDVANQQRKMLVVFFELPSDPTWQRFERDTLGSPDVQTKLRDMVCLRLPMDAGVTVDGKKIVLNAAYSLLRDVGTVPAWRSLTLPTTIRRCMARL